MVSGALSYLMPSRAEIVEVERARALVLQGNYPIFDVLPVVEREAGQVQWDVKANVTGRTPVRGLNEPFPKAIRPGANRFTSSPIQFAEELIVGEDILTNGGQLGTFGEKLDMGRYIDEANQEMQDRLWKTLAYIATRTLIDGIAYTTDKAGNLVRVSTYAGLAPLTPSVPWSTTAGATPIRDFQAIQEQAIGTGFTFDNRARGMLNTRTLNRLLNNTNQADLGGKRLSGLAQVTSLDDINKIFVGHGLPQLVVCDDSYLEAGTEDVVMFVPDGKVLLVGYHSSYGIKAGETQSTLYGPTGRPGLFVDTGITTTNPKLPYTAIAWNGGPSVRYEKQVRVINAY